MGAGTTDDITHLLPRLAAERVAIVKGALTEAIRVTEADYAELAGIDDMKTFALAAQKKLWPAALFSLKRGKVSDLDDFIRNATGEFLFSICEKVKPGLTELPAVEPEAAQ